MYSGQPMTMHRRRPLCCRHLPPPLPPCGGLDGLELHHIVVNDWDLPGGVTAPQNVVLISIASGKLRMSFRVLVSRRQAVCS